VGDRSNEMDRVDSPYQPKRHTPHDKAHLIWFCRFVDAEYERNYILVMLFLALVQESC
jgi:hypothetical protein